MISKSFFQQNSSFILVALGVCLSIYKKEKALTLQYGPFPFYEKHYAPQASQLSGSSSEHCISALLSRVGTALMA